jgi:hypothetical protein
MCYATNHTGFTGVLQATGNVLSISQGQNKLNRTVNINRSSCTDLKCGDEKHDDTTRTHAEAEISTSTGLAFSL